VSTTQQESDRPPVNDAIVLWDIDGTLVHETRGEGSRMQMRAIRDVLGVDLERPGFGAGATERMVWTRLFENAGMPVPDDLAPLEAAIDRLYVEHFLEVPRVAIPVRPRRWRHSPRAASSTPCSPATAGRSRA